MSDRPLRPLLTRRQELILRVLRENPLATVRQIGFLVGLRSTSTVYFHLTNLWRMGYIRRAIQRPTAWEVVE